MTPAHAYLTFATDGAWITTGEEPSYRFAGAPADLVSVLVTHPEIDLRTAIVTVIDRPFLEDSL